MKVLILNGSPKIERSNTLHVTDAFVSGFPEGTEVKRIDIYAKDIKPCRGCFACQKTQRCVIRDDADLIEQKMEKADVLVFATPIYYYEMSGQMKTMLDRAILCIQRIMHFVMCI